MKEEYLDVLYLLTQGSGGFPHYTAALANGVSESASVTVMKPSETTADDVFNQNIELLNVFQPGSLSTTKFAKGNLNLIENTRSILSYSAIKQIHQIDPDIVHITTNLLPHVRWFLWRYGIDKDYPVITTFHNTGFYIFEQGDDKHFSTRLMNLANKFSPSPDLSQIISHREDNQHEFRKIGYDPEIVSVIPHGSFQFFTDYDYDEMPEEDNTILFFGRIVPVKGVDVLIESVQLLKNKIPNIKLIIAGDGELSTESKKIIQNNPDRYELHNHYIPNEKVGTFFSRAQMAVIPSRRQQGHSGSLTVAYSFGTPVVTTNVGAFDELVANRSCGLTVPPDDAQELATAIKNVLMNDEPRQSMEKKAKETSEELSWENVARKHLQLYRRIQSGKL